MALLKNNLKAKWNLENNLDNKILKKTPQFPKYTVNHLIGDLIPNILDGSSCFDKNALCIIHKSIC